MGVVCGFWQHLLCSLRDHGVSLFRIWNFEIRGLVVGQLGARNDQVFLFVVLGCCGALPKWRSTAILVIVGVVACWRMVGAGMVASFFCGDKKIWSWLFLGIFNMMGSFVSGRHVVDGGRAVELFHHCRR